jgi:hypothetical protein
VSKVFDDIDAGLRQFIEAQHMVFVATAPTDTSGHVNLSPKGLDTFRVLGPRSVAYLDYVGSGAETIAHLRDNGRIVFMFCAFQGPPRIVRLHGHGDTLEAGTPGFEELRGRFPPGTARAIIRVAVDRVSDSCGFGVPLYRYEGERTQLLDWAHKKGERALEEYQRQKNARSIDGLPALAWPLATLRE